MAPEGNVTAVSSFLPSSDSKKYNRIKLGTGIVSSLLSFSLMVYLVATGSSRMLADWCSTTVRHPYGRLLIFSALVGCIQMILTLPCSWYSGFLVEHRFGLSNQTLARWAWEKIKETIVAGPVVAGVLMVLYYCLTTWGSYWWLPLSIALTLLSVVFARLAPILVLPLFYKLTPLTEGPLRSRIVDLCSRSGVYVKGIFTFNLSKNTRKANAAFTGIGKAKRIILGDTLVNAFTEEEVATVFAHELGHYRHHHIAIGMSLGVVSTFFGLYLTSLAYAWSVNFLGFTTLYDIAALPLLAVWLTFYGLLTNPLDNILSRRHERQADTYAVRVTRNGAAFISALQKLATMNLADPEPHPLVEFLFHSHPSIGKRIRSIESIRV